MTYPKPKGACPYCGGRNLRVKQWRSRGTFFVACECTATGPSMAKTPEEAVALFDKRSEPVQTRMDVMRDEGL